jgi:hypothetical protein
MPNTGIAHQIYRSYNHFQYDLSRGTTGIKYPILFGGNLRNEMDGILGRHSACYVLQLPSVAIRLRCMGQNSGFN